MLEQIATFTNVTDDTG